MEATQESTQPCTDRWAMGVKNSGLHEEDVADIICILHPNSHAAHDAIAATADFAPQHILQQDELGYHSTPTLDVALRLSSVSCEPAMGFIFGRNRHRCDVLLARDDRAKRVSNTHFRIYLTVDGILMLQDTSTNGTLVDNCRLQKRHKDRNSRMLANGSVIHVVSGADSVDEIRFIVRIPNRDGVAGQYTENFNRYIERTQPKGNAVTQPRTFQYPPQWTVGNTYGMHWSGGDLYNVTGLIGKGAFATVYKVADPQDGHVFACKELDKRRFMKNGILDQKVDNEMNIMKDLKHPNIVQFVSHHDYERWLYIIMEYVPCGELSTYLQSQGKIPEEMVRTIARQLLHALQYLHRRKITHRDIKPDNILIHSLDPLKIKLSDFGLSKVVQEETFLKTFCGTLLYCAPEVYPDYDTYRRGEPRKRRRAGDPPPKTSPYDQSVDMWSLGAVLFHILSGTPPFMGRAEDRGATMLTAIMTGEADYNVLREAGVSEAGIDFVSHLLNRDPHRRPKERECFKHPWIATVPDEDVYEDDGFTSDALDGLPAIGEDEEEEELDASQLSLNDRLGAGLVDSQEEVLAKKMRIDCPPGEILYPSLPQIESLQDFQPSATPNTRRLFGEITNSVLRSSDVMGEGLKAFDGDFSLRDFVSSNGESMSDSNSLNSVLSLPDNPFGGSAPSLMGAENLVGQLNMNSSYPALPNPWNPVAGRPRQPSSPGSAQEPESAVHPSVSGKPSVSHRKDTTPKAAKISGRIGLDLPETSSEHSSYDNIASEFSDNAEPGSVGEALFDIELATTLDARTGQEVSKSPAAPPAQENENAAYRKPTTPSLDLGSVPPSLEFAKPRPLLGRLVTLPGSIFDLTLRLEDRMTSWGRGPKATISHPDPMDTRIPAYALEVTFWTEGMEARLAAGEDWMHVPGVTAILSTKTRSRIWVNDIELRRGPNTDSEGFYFGKLYTGDIITVYRYQRQFLKFRCEFYHGDSVRVRPEKEKGFSIRVGLHRTKPLGAVNRLPESRTETGKQH
ncbi:hypothetical protein ASPZODRAFT_133203 [Penicilliopsis zonata CBS 506.65]|uniref:Protein kinase domain-containing protein n=1 Tax=Penicilliopsis zonata CBS 506.65 TaxID=1073090 RepID=A0A1L9SGA5_9EURO|nr:hypothetical protein ASPZODRAFT_133203 [Penicilliopsis zonata CBS 506.65]OJJ46201.1 hypothetical protein ASPZODRAFT_133203 [Penicilliopsis zonata CBS 506.65]